MPIDLTVDGNEWRIYFCIVGELWQAVRDRQAEHVIAGYLEELEGLSYTTSQDLLHARCQHVLALANGVRTTHRAGR